MSTISENTSHLSFTWDAETTFSEMQWNGHGAPAVDVFVYHSDMKVFRKTHVL